MSPGLESVAEALLAGVSSEHEIANLPLPGQFRAAVVERDREGVRVRDVPRPELEADEAYLAVMASSMNYTTVWAARGQPVPTHRFLARLGGRHDLPHHVVGSDAAGVVLRVGAAVRRWRPGDHVVVHPSVVDSEDPAAHDDDLMASGQRVWGYETNFGGLAELAVVKASQLLPKPAHLSWEEAASLPLCSATAYRMVVGGHGAAMRQGDAVLVWGAAGGVGAYAIQYVINGGGVPVGVVSSPEKAELLRRLGCEAVIDRRAEGYRFWQDDGTADGTADEGEWRRLGDRVRQLVGTDPDIVVEHPGRETMGASVYVARRGGTVVTCAATTGWRIEYDNRHLWMRLKRIVGTQLANYAEAAAANRLAAAGRILPALSVVHPLEDVAGAVDDMGANRHHGKIGILCLAPAEGLGVTDPERRAQVGEDRLRLFRTAGGAGRAGDAG